MARVRAATAAALLAVLAVAVTIVFAAESGNLDQCRNGTFTSPVHCDHVGGADGWVNGNAGGSNSHYREGDGIPYRMRFDGLTVSSTNELIIEWDTTQSGKHATDYLVSYDYTENVNNNPCIGVTGCNLATVNEFPIPIDPNVSANGSTDGQVGGQVFSCFGCEISGTTDYTVTGSYAGTSQTRIGIFFHASITNPVMAWGGHIATQESWGPGLSATGINGSPYHMRFIELNGKGGNQDRSLSADAVIGLALTTERSGLLTTNNFSPGTLFSDTAILTSTGTTEPILGSVQFYYCKSADAVTIPDCTTAPFSSTLTTLGGPIPVNGGPVVSVSSTTFAPTHGAYCFLAVFTSSSVFFNNISHTNQQTLGAGAECFIITAPTAVTLSSFEAGAQQSLVNEATIGFGLAGLFALAAVAVVVLRRK